MGGAWPYKANYQVAGEGEKRRIWSTFNICWWPYKANYQVAGGGEVLNRIEYLLVTVAKWMWRHHKSADFDSWTRPWYCARPTRTCRLKRAHSRIWSAFNIYWWPYKANYEVAGEVKKRRLRSALKMYWWQYKAHYDVAGGRRSHILPSWGSD